MPQLWAEDGRVFLSEAYQAGFWHTLFLPYAGYLQLVPRLAAGLALLFPLERAPLILDLIGLLVQAAPAAFILSDRWNAVIPSRTLRAVLALVYLGLPATAEININITNAQWHLAVLACMIIVVPSTPGQTRKILGASAVVLSGLSGPFAIFLAPGALLLAIVRRSAYSTTLAACTAITAVVEMAFLIHTDFGPTAGTGAQGFSGLLVLEVVVGRVIAPPLVGKPETTHLLVSSFLASAALDVAVFAIALVVSLLAWRAASLEVRMFCAFGALVLVASLVRLRDVLPLVRLPGAADRYFFIPILSWITLAASFTLQFRPSSVGKALTFGLALFMAFAIATSWEYPRLGDTHFYQAAEAFARAHPGQTVRIPENPPAWSFPLTKK